ncbi:MAG: hypothetical protein ACOCTJ_03285 [Desulfobia sp.]
MPIKLKSSVDKKLPTAPPRLSADTWGAEDMLKLTRQNNRKRPAAKEIIPVTSCLIVGDLSLPDIRERGLRVKGFRA